MQEVTDENGDISTQEDEEAVNYVKGNTKDSSARKAVEILSEKDLKIIGLKQQLRDLKSRNTGLVNCLKNQDSAVRKLGSLATSRSSSEMSDVLDCNEGKDVIDTAFKKVIQMNKSFEENDEVAGFDRYKNIRLSGELKLQRAGKQHKESTIQAEVKLKNEKPIATKEEEQMFHYLETKIRKLEDDIFARETAFRHLSRDKPINDEMLTLRLDQIRDERDKLYCILKHYEKIMLKEDPQNFMRRSEVGRKISEIPSGSLKIDAAVTINNTKENWPNREELLYHIEELRKCLEEIRKERKKKSDKLKHNAISVHSLAQKDKTEALNKEDGDSEMDFAKQKDDELDSLENEKEARFLRDDWPGAIYDKESKQRGYPRESNIAAPKRTGSKPKQTDKKSQEKRRVDYVGDEDTVENDMAALKNEAALFARKLHDEARQKDRAVEERDAVVKELNEKMKENEKLSKLVTSLGLKIERSTERERFEGEYGSAEMFESIDKNGDKLMSRGRCEGTLVAKDAIEGELITRDKQDERAINSDKSHYMRKDKSDGKILQRCEDDKKPITRDTDDDSFINRDKDGDRLKSKDKGDIRLTSRKIDGEGLISRDKELINSDRDNVRQSKRYEDDSSLIMRDRLTSGDKGDGRLNRRYEDDDRSASFRIRNHENELKKYQQILEMEKTEGPKQLGFHGTTSYVAEKPGVLSQEDIDEKREIIKVFSHRIEELEQQNAEASMTIVILKDKIDSLEDRSKVVETANEGLMVKIGNLKEKCNDKDLLLKTQENRGGVLERVAEDKGRENRQLEKKVVDLERRVGSLSEDKLYLQSKVVDLESEIARAKQQLLVEMEERNLVEERMGVLRDKEKGISIQAEDLKEKVAQLQKLSNSFETECNIAQDKEKTLRFNLGKQQDMNLKLEEQILELKKCLADEKKESKVLKERNEERGKKCEKLEEERDKIKSECENAKNKLKLMEKTDADKEHKINQFVKEIQGLKASRDDMCGKLEVMKDSKVILQKKLNSRNEELIEVQRELGLSRERQNETKRDLGEKNSALFELKRDVKNLREENNKLKLEFNDLGEEKKLVVIDLNKEKEIVNGLNTELSCAKEKIMTLTNEKLNIDAILRNREEKMKSLKKTVKDMSLEKHALENHITEFQKVVTDKVKTEEELKEEINNLTESTRDAEKIAKLKNDEVNKMTVEYNLLEIRYNEGQKEFTGLQKQLENCWQEKDDISKETEHSYKVIDELRGTLDRVLVDNQTKDSDLEGLRCTVKNKEAIIQELFGKVDSMNELIDLRDREIEERNRDIKELNDSLGIKEEDSLRFTEELRRLEDEKTELQEKLSKLRTDKMGISKDLDGKSQEIEILVSSMETLRARHSFEIEERKAKWQLCEEYNRSLKTQLDSYKSRELRLQESGRLMKKEVGHITGELQNAKMILKDFQNALLDKDNDLKKINDAVVLLEKSYASRQTDVQNKLSKVKGDFDDLLKENRKLKEELLIRKNKIQNLMRQKEEDMRRVDDANLGRMNNMEKTLKGKDKDIFFRDGKIDMLESENSRLKKNLADDGKEVEDLIQKLEGTLKDMKLQLVNVEQEKQQLQKEVSDGRKQRLSLEESMIGLIAELSKRKRNPGSVMKDFQEKHHEERSMFHGDEIIKQLKQEIFSLQREKDAINRRIEKERDDEILLKTSERMEKENLKIQVKNMKDDIGALKKANVSKDIEIKNQGKEVERLLAEKEDRKGKFETKETEYKKKIEEMSGNVTTLEKKISKAVCIAESERYEREAVLAQLLDKDISKRGEYFRNVGNFTGNIERLESTKWRNRAQALTQELENLHQELSRYRNKSLTDMEGMLSVVETAKAEQILNLKKELAETYKDKLAYQSKLNNLCSELDKQRDEKHQFQKNFDLLNEEYRMAKNEVLIHKSEIDWLRNALSMRNAVK